MSRIEQLFGEIEEYIDSCKYQPLSNTKILVNKEEMEELLVELRLRVPEEIKKYQKIISQQDAILADAKAQADMMLNDARTQTEEMVSDNEIMQKAYEKANALLQDAQKQADGIVNNAVADADQIRNNAIRYTDEMLAFQADGKLKATIILEDAARVYDGENDFSSTHGNRTSEFFLRSDVDSILEKCSLRRIHNMISFGGLDPDAKKRA